MAEGICVNFGNRYVEVPIWLLGMYLASAYWVSNGPCTVTTKAELISSLLGVRIGVPPCVSVL